MTITFISGSMFGGKSKALIDVIQDVKKFDEVGVTFKPVIDTRDGLFIKSRDYDISIPASPWDHKDPLMKVKFTNLITSTILLSDKPKSVFFDEAHFISEDDVKFIVETCRQYDVNLYMSGLETDFKLNWFPSTKWLKGICDSYIFFCGKCNKCRKDNAVYNILLDSEGNRVSDGSSIQVGDSEYIVLCDKCLNDT